MSISLKTNTFGTKSISLQMTVTELRPFSENSKKADVFSKFKSVLYVGLKFSSRFPKKHIFERISFLIIISVSNLISSILL